MERSSEKVHVVQLAILATSDVSIVAAKAFCSQSAPGSVVAWGPRGSYASNDLVDMR